MFNKRLSKKLAFSRIHTQINKYFFLNFLKVSELNKQEQQQQGLVFLVLTLPIFTEYELALHRLWNTSLFERQCER